MIYALQDSNPTGVWSQRNLTYSQMQLELGLGVYVSEPWPGGALRGWSPTRRFLGTGMVSVCVAKATERLSDIPHRRLAWCRRQRQAAAFIWEALIATIVETGGTAV